MKKELVATKTPLIKKLPPPRFNKVPCCEMLVRGTSTQYSKNGSIRELWGTCALRADNAISNRPIPIYVISPMEENEAAWNRRFEATIHAAVERALWHSGKINMGSLLVSPKCTPVVAIGILTHPLMTLMLGEPYPQTSKEVFEWALVNGRKTKTFQEGELRSIGVYNLEEPQKQGYGYKTIRIELTTEEWANILKNANEFTNIFGLDMQGEIKAEGKYVSDVVRLKEDLYFEEEIGEEELEEVLEPLATWYDHSKSIIGQIFGYELPETLKETGKHASNGYSYLVGELVKHTMIPKIYSAIKEKLGELDLLR